MISNIPEEISCEIKANKLKFSLNGLSTNWMDDNDLFIGRIDKNNLNKAFLTQHLSKEIEIKNTLDEGIGFLRSQKYSKAIEKFDDVLFYDSEYGEALLHKSFSLRGQKHFVKALRNYKLAVKCDDSLKDIDYHKCLLREANNERADFPKLKLNIYAGDEYFAKGDYEKAVDSYDSALKNPSKFKVKILSKLLNKKATALLKMNEYDEALECFNESQKVGATDYAVYGEGYCEHELGLQLCEKFKTRLDITKKQMLCQVQILNESDYFTESLIICDYLCENHFKIDDFYQNLLSARRNAMNALEMDLTKIDAIINQINE